MSKQITYFIEGGDNVGKTTLINHISQNFIKDYRKKESIKSIEFGTSKYPTKDNTKFMNTINHILNFCNDYKILISKDDKYNDIYSRVNKLLINTMIKDMNESFINNIPVEKYWDCIDVSDRGPLSTYLYNYKDIDNINEIHNFEKFIKNYVMPELNLITKNNSIANLNIVILNNNKPDIPIVSNKQEDIEYKKNFDNNIELQQKINNQISNIVTSIDNEENIDTITYPFKLHYINIYHDNGIRKTTEEVYKEFLNFIFNTIKEENNNE